MQRLDRRITADAEELAGVVDEDDVRFDGMFEDVLQFVKNRRVHRATSCLAMRIMAVQPENRRRIDLPEDIDDERLAVAMESRDVRARLESANGLLMERLVDLNGPAAIEYFRHRHRRFAQERAGLHK